jgi:hypothetical protein
MAGDYETMAYWDAPVEGYPPEHRDFAGVWLPETRRFASGVIQAHCRVRGGTP